MPVSLICDKHPVMDEVHIEENAITAHHCPAILTFPLASICLSHPISLTNTHTNTDTSQFLHHMQCSAPYQDGNLPLSL